MENSQLYLNKIMLNITTSKDQNLNFVKGEVLRGMVQDIKADGLVSLFIKGQMIDAVSEVLVQPGQQLQLMVEDFRDGRAYLKVLTPQLMERIENSNISLNLTEIGVPAKEENIMMARKLLHYKLPVTSNNLNLMSKAMVILGGANEKNAEIVAFSMARKLPLDAPTLKSLAQFLMPANDVSKLAGNLDKGLLQLEQTVARMVETSGSSHIASSRPVGEMGTEATRQPGISGDKLIAEKVFSATAVANKGSESMQVSSKGPEIQGFTGTKSGEVLLPGEGRPALGQASSAPEAKIANVIEQNYGKIKLEALLSGNSKNISELPVEPADARRNITLTGEKAAAVSSRVTTSSSPTQASPQSENVTSTSPAVNPAKAGGETSAVEKTLLGQITATINSKESTLASETGKNLGGSPAMDQGKSASSPVLVNEKATLEGGKSPGVQTLESTINKKEPASGIIKNVYTPTATSATSGRERQPLVTNLPVTDGKTVNVPELLPGNISDKALSSGGMPMDSYKQISGQGAIAQVSPPIIAEGVTEVFKEAFALLTNPNNDWTAPEQRELLRHLPLLRTLLETLHLNLEGDSREIGNRLQNAFSQERDIIRGLNLLQDIIKNDSITSKNPLMADLFNRIEGMERELSAQRMLNFASRGAVDSSSNYFYFAFPVQCGEKYRLGQLRINRELGKRGLNKQDNIRFIVSLDTVQMGVVLFHVNWKRLGELEVQGVVERQEIREYLNRNLGELFQGLESLGYRIKNLGIKVVEQEEEMRLRLALEETPLNFRPFGIDVRV